MPYSNEQFKVRFLDKNLLKFIRLATGKKHKDQLKAKADCYRKLRCFEKTLKAEIKKLESGLIDMNIEYYFIEDNEKIIIDETYQKENNEIEKKVIIIPMKGVGDYFKAKKQNKEK